MFGDVLNFEEAAATMLTATLAACFEKCLESLRDTKIAPSMPRAPFEASPGLPALFRSIAAIC